MQARLTKVIIFNFKSFHGEFVINSFSQFVSIIGPNGSGKSNFIDAISFVLGERSQHLRTSRLQNLVCKNLEGKAVKDSTYVTAVFKTKDGSVSFTRTIYTFTEYKINNEVVTSEFYLSKLASLGISIKSNCFLIYQGAIESMDMKSSKDITIILEEISGSDVLKLEYERLKAEIHEADVEFQHIMKNKKYAMKEKKNAILEEKEANEYLIFYNEYIKKLKELQLFQLFHIKTDYGYLENKRKEVMLKISKLEDNKKCFETSLKTVKEQYNTMVDKQVRMEQILEELERKIAETKLQSMLNKERISFLKMKLEESYACVVKVETREEARKKVITNLLNELSEIEQMKILWTDNTKSELQSFGSNIELTNEQVKEYWQLKHTAQQLSAENIEQLNSLIKNREKYQDDLDYNNKRKNELEDILKRKMCFLKDVEERLQKWKYCVENIEETLIKEKTVRNNLEIAINMSKDRIEVIKDKLKEVSEKHDHLKYDKHASEFEKKKLENIKILKQLFPEVHDRLSRLCKPIHSRYDIAVTKIFWKHKDAIVIDTIHAAKQCINYLREQKMGKETFLPLNYLKVESLKERLRNIEHPRNVKLLFDVVKFAPKEVYNAILYITKNTLICEAPEDAYAVAYQIEKDNRQDAVALDGTFYQRSGIFSGGKAELARKVSVIYSQEINELELLQVTLMNELKKERQCYPEQRFESNSYEMKIQQLSKKLYYARFDLENTERESINLHAEIKQIEKDLKSLNSNIALIEDRINNCQKNIINIEELIHKTEDTVFEAFCKNIGVTNVRIYEKDILRIYKMQERKKLEIENHYNQIKNMLDFEKSRNSEDELEKYRNTVKYIEKQLNEAYEEDHFDKELLEIEDNKAKQLLYLQEVKTKVDNMFKKIGKCRHCIGTIAASILTLEKELTMITLKIKHKVIEWRAMIKQYQIQNLNVLEENQLKENAPLSFSSSDTSNFNVQEFSQIDFSNLQRELHTRCDFENTKEHLLNEVKKVEDKLASISQPNLKAYEVVKLVNDKLRKLNLSLKKVYEDLSKKRKQFEAIKNKRIKIFLDCLNHLVIHIDKIFKDFFNDQSAQAILTPYNPEEPYLDGIHYSCIIPKKRFVPLSNLSGGEKVLATLTLFFAIHSYKPIPLFIMDEIDAALDDINIKRLVNFIKNKISGTQFIITSLKINTFKHADALIGVAPNRNSGYQESCIFEFPFISEYVARI